MNKTGKLATFAVTAVAVGGLSGGIALAQPSHKATVAPTRPAAAVEATTPDTDNVQEGDQSTPDVAAVAKTATVVRSVARPSATGEDSEGASESEGSGQSDGPGGHQDPAGDVQHEGDAGEQ